VTHGTFRPVSILDRGLEINEDDMIYETDNVRATLHPEMEDYDQQRMTELQQREYFNEYGSFADNKGSLMIDPRFTG